MAWWEERLRLLRQQTIRERFPFVPVVEVTLNDVEHSVYPWGGAVTLQVVQSYNRTALVHTVLVCSKVLHCSRSLSTDLLQSEIDYMARAMRAYSTQAALPPDALIICLYVEAADLDLASTLGIEVYLFATVSISIVMLDSHSLSAQRSGNLRTSAGRCPLASSPVRNQSISLSLRARLSLTQRSARKHLGQHRSTRSRTARIRPLAGNGHPHLA